MNQSTWSGRWSHLRKVLERGGPLAHPDFEASDTTLDFLLNDCKVINTFLEIYFWAVKILYHMVIPRF